MIPLYVTDGIAYVWNCEDWHTLRSEHRICGALIGSIPSHPRQNDLLGLPMALLSEEATLLVKKGICELFQVRGLTAKPTDEEKELHKEFEKKSIAEQQDALRKRKIEQLSQKIDIILAGKKKKLEAKGISDFPLDKESLLQEEINKIPNVTAPYTLLHLPTHHLMDLEKHKVGTYVLNPSSSNEEENNIRYLIFKDLWEKGHHITSGSKFGCDYLVYPGDPVKFHATFMVRCVYDLAALFSLSSVVAFGRLSVAVNKLAVFAYLNYNGKVEYQTLHWHDST